MDITMAEVKDLVVTKYTIAEAIENPYADIHGESFLGDYVYRGYSRNENNDIHRYINKESLQYVPRNGPYWQHDYRVPGEAEEDISWEPPKKKSIKEKIWSHDMFVAEEQALKRDGNLEKGIERKNQKRTLEEANLTPQNGAPNKKFRMQVYKKTQKLAKFGDKKPKIASAQEPKKLKKFVEAMIGKDAKKLIGRKEEPKAEKAKEVEKKPFVKMEMKKEPVANCEGGKKKRFVLFVGNLSYETTADDIKKHFLTKVSDVSSVEVPSRPDTSTSCGIAFVELTNETDCQKGLSLQNTNINGSRINVEYCQGGSKSVGKRSELVSENKKNGCDAKGWSPLDLLRVLCSRSAVKRIFPPSR